MIKKSLGKAIAGTVAAGALALPAATVVAPSFQLVACQYPKSVSTTTSLDIEDDVIRPGQTTQVEVEVDAAKGVANGKVILTVAGPGGQIVREKVKEVGPNDSVTFSIGNFKLPKRMDAKTYRVQARFVGGCQFTNSRDVDYLVVTRGN